MSMTFRGSFNFRGRFTKLDHSLHLFDNWLVGEAQDPLHFAVAGYPEHDVLPYFELNEETFSCFPLLVDNEV